MTVQDLMTASPATCARGTSLKDVARMMVDEDCGAIPVVDGAYQPVGVVTDRDIVVRLVAEGQCPLEKTAVDAMTEQVVTVRANAGTDEAARLMKEHQIRRLVVVDGGGAVAGVVAQADLARTGADRQTGDVVEGVSAPNR